LINLISNAIKYTDRGSVTLSINYRNQVAKFTVSDTGVGISKQDQANIFKPFEQLSHAHSEGRGGAGLGLTISRSLTDLMGGEISVKSELGKGSSFTLRLMLVQLNKSANVPESSHQLAVGYAGHRRTLLVVDDDPNQRQLMHDLLAPLGFDVVLAENGEKGLHQLAENQVDLIILDVRMPVMDGWHMLENLRKQSLITPVIMLSADPRDAQSEAASKHHHNVYMAKPVNLDALLGKIGELLKLYWLFEQTQHEVPLNQPTNALPLAGEEQYKLLISLAEIGYLSGFKQKLTEIAESYQIPDDVAEQIDKYVELCNFPKMIQFLDEQCHG